MALAIADGLIKEGISTKVLNLRYSHRSEVMTEVLDAKAIICGTSTLNNNMLPRMADMLTYMKGLKPVNRIGAVFGSYGWSGEAVGQVTQYPGRYENYPGGSRSESFIRPHGRGFKEL